MLDEVYWGSSKVKREANQSCLCIQLIEHDAVKTCKTIAV
jgi:hypothetical protein